MPYPDFDQLPSFARLRELARQPYDLTAPDSLPGERFRRYTMHCGDIDLFYATQRLDDHTLTALQELANEAGVIDQFMAMKGGAIMNRIAGWASEQRQVLHTASRDVFTDAPLEPEASRLAREQLHRLKQFLDDLETGRIGNQRGEPFTTMIQVGIGGSDLGPRALCLALEPFARPGRRVRFIANVDPDDAAAVLAGVDLSRTLINVVSKSGSTLETLTNETLVRHALAREGLAPKDHMIAVTGQGSPMDDPDRYRACFHMYDFIGGRFSATSMVGAVTLAFLLGYDQFLELLAGAHAMDQAAEEPDIRKNLPLLLALLGIWNHNFLGYGTTAVLPYSQGLHRFPAHLQQCDMESNGKSITRAGKPVRWQTGPIVWGEPGTNGQHAFYQLLHQGTELVPVEFIGFRRNQREQDLPVQGTTSQEKLVANLLAQCLAMARGQDDVNPNKRFPGNRPSVILMADRLTPQTMGQLLALYEHKIAFQGFLWNINSFDQEGVQLGKVLATRLLAEIARRRQGRSRPAASDTPEEALLDWSRLILS